MKNLKLASQETEHRTVANVSGVEIGRDFVVIAGPCSVESEKQILDTARAVKAAGADMLRGGAFKPRTSPYAFQGLGIQGLKILEKALGPEHINVAVVCENMAGLYRKIGKENEAEILETRARKIRLK